jgi:predicted DNA-binding protein YlxM (UPF0122 family)
MGRWYSGDINGKFWVGIQSSCDGDFFGVEGLEDCNDDGEPSNELFYSFSNFEESSVKNGIKRCKEELGKYEKRIDKFFKEHKSYNDEDLAAAILDENDDTIETDALLMWYARLKFGQKILNCIRKKGKCEFYAEL